MRYVFILAISGLTVVNGGNNTINRLGDFSTTRTEPVSIDSVTIQQAILCLADSIKTIYTLPVERNTLADWLYTIALLESKGKTTSVNPHTGDSGLWQFSPITQSYLNITNITEQSIEVQCHWYLIYLSKLGNKPYKIRTAGDLYALNYLPGRFYAKNLTQIGDKYYDPWFDYNRDGRTTKQDLNQHLNKRLKQCTSI